MACSHIGQIRKPKQKNTLCRFNSGPLFTTLPQHEPNSVFECIAGHTCPENAKQHMMMTQC